MWYALNAYNSPVMYGWTDDIAVVYAALDNLNNRHEKNLYGYVELSNDQAVELELETRSDLLFTQDSTTKDFE